MRPRKGSEGKAQRQKLFGRSKPRLRLATREDLVWIRVNQKLAGVVTTDEEFEANMERAFSQYSEVTIIEDANSKFGSRFGPVGLVAAVVNGSVYEPHVEWFAWATPRNILRGAVAFFQKFRYRQIGVIVVHSLDDSVGFFRRLKRYVPLFYVGKIPDGDPAGRGDDYIFYQRCREL